MTVPRLLALALLTLLGIMERPALGQTAPAIPEFLTMDQKLAASEQVFVGTGRRLYFLGPNGRELPFDQGISQAPGQESQPLILEVAVEQALHAANGQRISGMAKLVIAPAPGAGAAASSGGGFAERLIGKQAIYFAKRQDRAAALTAGAGPLAAPAALHSLVRTPAQRGPVDNPLPISELQTVMNAMMTNGHSTEDPNCF